MSESLTILDRTFKAERFTKKIEAKIVEASLGSSWTSLTELGRFDACIYTVYSKALNEELEFITALAKHNPDLYFVYFSSASVYGEVYSSVIESIEQDFSSQNRHCELLLPRSNPARNPLNLIEALQLINYTAYSKLSPITEQAQCKPVNDYGRNKLVLEQLVQKLFKRHLIIRISNPYGREFSNRGFAAIVKDTIRNQSSPLIKLNADFPGQIVRDFVYIDDFVRMVDGLISNQAQGVYNLASGEGLRLEELIQQLTVDSNKDIQLEYCSAKADEIKFSVLDNQLLKALCGLPSK